jgi:predicted metalloprotease with PDZ domain
MTSPPDPTALALIGSGQPPIVPGDMRAPTVFTLALFLALASCASAQQHDPAPPGDRPGGDWNRTMISYHVNLAEARAHRVHVRMSIVNPPAGELAVSMPVWTPGSYLVREFARNVLDLSASDAAGASLPVVKVNKNTWTVDSGSAAVVHVDYELYANERSVRTNHADDSHAFLQPAATFLYLREQQAAPHRVTVQAPADWAVHTGLREDGDGWLADDYDMLVDCPLEIGPHRVLRFEHEGIPFRIVLAGEGELDETALVEDVGKIVAEVSSIFGLIPFDDYTFIIPLVDSGGGGLEHKNSSVSMTSRWNLGKKKSYRGFMSLLAHEFLHAWNVKRFRPETLGPFDYDVENYTTDLWVAEGITSYYDDLSTLRAGFADSASEYLSGRADAFRGIARLPGAQRSSLSRASHDTWIKQYRPDENSRNHSVSYYTKGALVGLMLDLRIRRLSDGQRTLADALRLGWERYTAQGMGYPDGSLRELAGEVAGTDLSAFFADHVDGTADLEPNEDLAWVGLELKISPETSERDLAEDDDGFLLEPDLGISTSDNSGFCRVSGVLEDSAAFNAGLNVDDLIVAVNGVRVKSSTIQDRLDRAHGEPVEISYFRGQSMRSMRVQPDLKRLEKWKLVPLSEASDRQREEFERWTGSDFPDSKPDEDEQDQD